jgi:transcriptional regulator with XRE-family HTH domain
MPHRRRIGLKERQRLFELESQGLSVQKIAERMGISFLTAKQILAKRLFLCARCGRVSDSGGLCPVCSLPAEAPFCDRLKAFRTIAGVSQMSLGLAMGVHESRVRNWEKGRKQPTEHELQMLAAALGLTVHELTGKGESHKGV